MISKEFCDYLFNITTLNKFGKGYKCGFEGKINENIVIKLGENSTLIKKGFEILEKDTIEFIPGRLYYLFCSMPKTTKDLLISVE